MVTMIDGGVCAPKGFIAGGVHCGIRQNKSKKDLAMIACSVPCTAAAVYTKNKVCGAPVAVTRRHLARGVARAVICNSGNANTCNADGEEKAEKMAELTAAALEISPKDVIVASTGVIGLILPIEPVAEGIKALAPILSPGGSRDAALAIMTTDTVIKEAAAEVKIGGKTVRIGAIAKGSGMIHPNMATMLSFITTDAAITAAMLRTALARVTEDTYNMISVDGDTSTNDMVSVMASGLAVNKLIDSEGADFTAFTDALFAVVEITSRAIAADGEGATKLLTCHVNGAPDKLTARKTAKTIITSSLVKAAMFGGDANWGRILCAIGYVDAEFDINSVDVDLSSAKGTVRVCRSGNGAQFDEDAAALILKEKEIIIDVKMGQGSGTATAWGCDLTYDYVKINGMYRT
jgi:glutamate N-acetyltransferase / amino-acid N-acetyltransferase